jgi:hypothetical protein
MCPICLTTATVVAATTTSGAGLLGLLAVKFRAWRWLRSAGKRPAQGGRDPGLEPRQAGRRLD